mmetsp:Transcript_78783/g.245388  ORF Transcript_78783/g.245388 Transcript_78783/m.245388 type:complete len:360 (+) Transcript_78783:484-1563(+)
MRVCVRARVRAPRPRARLRTYRPASASVLLRRGVRRREDVGEGAAEDQEAARPEGGRREGRAVHRDRADDEAEEPEDRHDHHVAHLAGQGRELHAGDLHDGLRGDVQQQQQPERWDGHVQRRRKRQRGPPRGPRLGVRGYAGRIQEEEGQAQDVGIEHGLLEVLAVGLEGALLRDVHKGGGHHARNHKPQRQQKGPRLCTLCVPSHHRGLRRRPRGKGCCDDARRDGKDARRLRGAVPLPLHGPAQGHAHHETRVLNHEVDGHRQTHVQPSVVHPVPAPLQQQDHNVARERDLPLEQELPTAPGEDALPGGVRVLREQDEVRAPAVGLVQQLERHVGEAASRDGGDRGPGDGGLPVLLL